MWNIWKTGLLLAIAWPAAAGAKQRHGAEKRAGAVDPPHVVVILTDDQRADYLGCAGHPMVRTPHIDR
ncbi:MAG: hypothetical protein GTO53_12195 [Planctomycetales bacterium]|nr:hypothetical protein [Planctomycetales bacterium]NIM09870.1 hypothetical protein [Planctomycetales bacterium]NIN09310.1 hypothetical protein [Planctomycetales bacterium]NIN78418.1 hypothetical protein [Planctomycetales bacterium]NIO35594.1 hypothetical protein [Planctomycetales bacterium]